MGLPAIAGSGSIVVHGWETATVCYGVAVDLLRRYSGKSEPREVLDADVTDSLKFDCPAVAGGKVFRRFGHDYLPPSTIFPKRIEQKLIATEDLPFLT